MILKSRYVAKNVNGIRTVVQNHHELPFIPNAELKQFFFVNAHWLGISVFDMGSFVDKLMANSKVNDEYDEDWVKGGLNPVDKNSHVEFKLYDNRLNLKIKISDIHSEKRFLKLMQLSGVRWCDGSIVSDANDTELDQDGCDGYIMYIVDNGILSIIDSKWTYENINSLPELSLKEIEQIKI